MRPVKISVAIATLLLFVVSCARLTKGVQTDPAVQAQKGRTSFDEETDSYMKRLYEEGQKIFRNDTFGSEAFWGDQLQLHRAILGDAQDGVAPGISPRAALKLGLKVDQGEMPEAAVEMVKRASLDLDKPETTLALLKANAVVGLTGIFKDNKLVSVGIQCALCHSTVDDSLSPGI